MAKYGLQPNGTVILDDGRVWNPNDALPPESVAAFNSTPMGSPLNGLGTMAPTAVAPQPAQPAPTGPKGMMFAGLPKANDGNFSGIAQGQDGSLTTPLYDMPTGNVPTPKSSFFGEGGTGRSIAGYIGDALAQFGGMKPIYAPYVQEQRNLGKEALQQQMEYQRQLALARYKNANPEPGSIEKNYTFLNGKDPSLGTSYLNAEANPQTLVMNPATGAAMFVPKGGVAAKPAPQVGAVEQGYQFVGGDPAQPTSWRKVQ